MSKKQIVAQNRRARYDYHLEEILEAGIVLSGTEVKSLRSGSASIMESYIAPEGNEILMHNCNIPQYSNANRFNHHPKRSRKLLLHRREINKISGKVRIKGYTIVPISIYFDERNIAKVEIALAKGKDKHDKRASLKEKEWNREKQRIRNI